MKVFGTIISQESIFANVVMNQQELSFGEGMKGQANVKVIYL